MPNATIIIVISVSIRVEIFRNRYRTHAWAVTEANSMIVPGIGTNCNTRKIGPFYSFWSNSPHWAMTSVFTRYLDHTQRRTTVGRTPLKEWSARRRDLYLTTHDTHSRQTSVSPVGFEPTISAGERPKTYALDRAATGTGKTGSLLCINISLSLQTEAEQAHVYFTSLKKKMFSPQRSYSAV